jgi:sugar O-acyltransferase (sialic acid O-acetyltransferase NeuD family)
MKRALIGAGGFANEVRAHIGDFTMKCFVDDQYFTPNKKHIYPLSKFDPKEYEVLVAIGDPKSRYDIIQRLPKSTKYFKFIHPSAQILGNDVYIGEGSIICAGSILTTNIKIGKHSHLNLHTTIGHDCTIGDYFTTAPGTKISGNCKIYDLVYLGTNSSIKQDITIHSLSTIGLNSGVVKDIWESGVYVGTPAEKLINRR